MKRFDPAYEALGSMVRGLDDRLRYVSVEVNDPDAWPFVAHRDLCAGDDVPAAMIDRCAKSSGRADFAGAWPAADGCSVTRICRPVLLQHHP